MTSQLSNTTHQMHDLPTLRDLLPEARILLNITASDWREAIAVAGQLLLNTGAIEPSYINAMVKTAEELGQYIVVTKGIALPHARPEDGALKTALSLVTLEPALEFGNPDHDPVSVVIALSAMDKELHVRALTTIAKLLLSQELTQRFFSARSVEDIYAAFDAADLEDHEE